MERFTGPVFLVGMPRSGTKLLRGLLVRHPMVGIPHVETDFLKQWIDNWASFGDLSDKTTFQAFYQLQMRQTYFWDYALDSEVIGAMEWYELCESDFSLTNVFEVLIRHNAGVPDNAIYGDKSPSYIEQLGVLKRVFPQARFIHIVRDVRDYALSMESTWGKDMLRASQRWADCLRESAEYGQEFKGSYLEVRYEDILTDTRVTLEKCCDFLGIQFVSEMLSLEKNYEPNGAASTSKEILSGNKEKYIELMSRKRRMKIESLTCDLLQKFGYAVEYEGHIQRISPILMRVKQIKDAVNLIRYEAKSRGFIEGIMFHVRHFFATR